MRKFFRQKKKKGTESLTLALSWRNPTRTTYLLQIRLKISTRVSPAPSCDIVRFVTSDLLRIVKSSISSELFSFLKTPWDATHWFIFLSGEELLHPHPVRLVIPSFLDAWWMCSVKLMELPVKSGRFHWRGRIPSTPWNIIGVQTSSERKWHSQL